MIPLEDRIKWAERADKNQNPANFFRQHYDPDTTRSQLAKKDCALYRILSRKRLLDEAIPDFDHETSERVRRARTEVSRFGNDPFAYYQEHHAGLTRGQLWKQDQSLYQRLRSDGLLDQVPVTRTDFGNDPVAYYQEHYAGLTRGQLKKQDPSLYQRLRRNGLLDNVPAKPIKIR
ncbi:hypothetical protein HYU19_01045 [Candidatus Woesearchaeota archaeon]|nr:hypothetical protein [Candidatus Woesearchaeota archaeon]